MAILVIVKGPQAGRHFPLRPGETIIGRQSDSAVCLEAREVSRHHARISCHDGGCVIEDLGSINRTYVNGQPIVGSVPLTDNDTLQIGPYVFNLRPDAPGAHFAAETPPLIVEQVSVSSTNPSLYDQSPAHKLQVVLEIAQHLARTLDVEALVDKLLDQLMQLFPQADRGMVLLGDAARPTIRAVRNRDVDDSSNFLHSRTIVKHALEQGVGIFSEDMRATPPIDVSESIRSLNLRSLLCVPLICQDGTRLGVIQLDRCRPGNGFRREDLHLLTTVGLQVAVVLENAALHAELLREERLRQELAVARDIQQGFLPTEFPEPARAGYELYGQVFPARQVSGDLYDYFALPDGKLAFSVGDVSGKGVPAALFMVMVRTLNRHLAAVAASPAETLTRLNQALAMDNPACMFVTMVQGIYDPATGALLLASGGHPPPLLRRAAGTIEPVAVQPGLVIGCETTGLQLTDISLTLAPGETLILYTDGCLEARAPESRTMFGLERLRQALAEPGASMPLVDSVQAVKAAVEQFTQTTDLQDDLTLLLLRRTPWRDVHA